MAKCLIPDCKNPAVPGRNHCSFHQPRLDQALEECSEREAKNQEGTLRSMQQSRSTGAGAVVRKMQRPQVQEMSECHQLELFTVLCDLCARTDSPNFADRMERRLELLCDSLLERVPGIAREELARIRQRLDKGKEAGTVPDGMCYNPAEPLGKW